MLGRVTSDDLEKEIILMQQELTVKRDLLDECRKKLTNEMSEHSQTKSIASKYSNENTELKVQMEINLAATKKLEQENSRNREILIKLQVQMDAYMNERRQILERCYVAETQNESLKRELEEVKQELKQHLSFLDSYKDRQSKTEALVNEIIKKQEILDKEQKKLEMACGESLKISEKLSEEAKLQMKFVEEANAGQRKMEEEIIRCMALYRQLQSVSNGGLIREAEAQNYVEECKRCQKEMKRRNEELEDDNKRLQEELKFVMEQNEILMNKF